MTRSQFLNRLIVENVFDAQRPYQVLAPVKRRRYPEAEFRELGKDECICNRQGGPAASLRR